MQEEALEWNLGFIVIESTITRDVDQDNQPLPGTHIKMINHYQVLVSRGSYGHSITLQYSLSYWMKFM